MSKKATKKSAKKISRMDVLKGILLDKKPLTLPEIDKAIAKKCPHISPDRVHSFSVHYINILLKLGVIESDENDKLALIKE